MSFAKIWGFNSIEEIPFEDLKEALNGVTSSPAKLNVMIEAHKSISGQLAISTNMSDEIASMISWIIKGEIIEQHEIFDLLFPAVVSSTNLTTPPLSKEPTKEAPASWANAVDINQENNSSMDVALKDNSYTLGGVVLGVNSICDQLRFGKRPPGFLNDSKLFEGKEWFHLD